MVEEAGHLSHKEYTSELETTIQKVEVLKDVYELSANRGR